MAKGRIYLVFVDQTNTNHRLFTNNHIKIRPTFGAVKNLEVGPRNFRKQQVI